MTNDELIAGLLRQLAAPDPDARSEAAGALGALGGDGAVAVEPLLEACRDPSPHVRGEAAHSLWELAGSCVGAVPAAHQRLVAGVPVLIVLLDDPSADVRDSVVGVLERLGRDAESALPRLRELLAREQSSAVARAAETIAGPHSSG